MSVAQMFPETVEEFMEEYKMIDKDHIYSNGIEYVPIFRMKQWFEHISSTHSKLEKNSKELENKNGELISRQEAVDEIEEWIIAFRVNGHKESAADACLIRDGIIQLPSVPRKGKWIDYSDEGYVECPFYHSATNCDGNKDELHYCFLCGAELR